MAPALPSNPAKSASPASRNPLFRDASGIRFTPTSMTAAPSRTMSAVSVPGRPAATTTMSARRVWLPTSRVFVWHTVTVASSPFCESITDSGRPTIPLRPSTTTSAPTVAIPLRRRISTMPAGVHGFGPSSPATNRPTFTGWNPSTSLSGSMASMTARSIRGSGSGNCTRIPSTAASPFSDATAASTSSSPAFPGSASSFDASPHSAQAFSFPVT